MEFIYHYAYQCIIFLYATTVRLELHSTSALHTCTCCLSSTRAVSGQMNYPLLSLPLSLISSFRSLASSLINPGSSAHY
jgi:hypothetical protein